MVKRHYIDGYDNFCEFMEKFDSEGELVHIYFGGSKLPSGISWCEDCVRGKWGYVFDDILTSFNFLAAPIIEEALEKTQYEGHFIYVQVGDRS